MIGTCLVVVLLLFGALALRANGCLTWRRGRQAGANYRKMMLATSQRLNFDFYIIQIFKGTEIPKHRDPAPEGWAHHRINITLRRAARGGITWLCIDGIWRHRWSRVYKFRPDIQEHEVSRVHEGNLVLLSFGWLSKT